MQTRKELFDYLDRLGIQTVTHEHAPVFTVEQALQEPGALCGAPVKNLFLKDDKKCFWLIVAHADTPIRLKELGREIGAPNLRFAQPELLMQYLGVEPGSVTPFGLINDTQHIVRVILDQRLFDFSEIGVHPLINSATTAIAPGDLKQFIHARGNTVTVHILNT